MQQFLRTLTLVALLVVPWVTQGQNARVSEYDYSVSTATYSTVAGTAGATAWTASNQAAGYVDIAMPFAMYFGETQIAAGSMLRVNADGSAEFVSLAGSRIAPLYLAGGYTTTATSVYTKSSAQQLVVEWRKVVSGANSYSFQLKLYPTGDVEFCYGPMTISSSINVLVGMMSSDVDIFRVDGSDWSDITRYTSGLTTRTLSSSNYPEFNTATNQGLVYTFTQPACVKPTGITATATAWNTIDVSWTVSSNGNGYEVKYSTDSDFDPTTEGTSKTINNGATLTTSITGLNGSTTYYFYVRKNCSGAVSGWSPMASATTLPGCFSANMPSVTPDGVVTWTSPNELVTSYDVKYGLSGFDPATAGTAINNISGLTTTLPVASMAPAASFDIYIRTHCSASGLTTDWVGPVSFNTPCAAITISATSTINEGFEGSTCPPACWSAYVPSSANPIQHVTDNYYSGAQSFRFSSYSSADEYDQYLISPELNSTNAMTVAFKYARNGSSDNIQLGYSSTGNAITDFTWMDWMTEGEGSWASYEAMVPANTKYIAIHYYGNYAYYVWVDDLTITPPPSCPKPSALTNVSHSGNSVTLSWTENGTATAWQIAYGLFTTDDDYTIVDATTNPFTVTNLGLGEWQFFVRSNCAADDKSGWIGPVSQTFGYCTPAPTSHDNNGITNVSFGNTLVVNDNNATTAATRYQNHSDMIGDFFAGTTAEVNITLDAGYSYGTKVWVDWNNDFEFSNDEQVYFELAPSTRPYIVNAVFSIPPSAPLGDYRMRIGATDNDAGPDPCYTGSYGVMRDYTIRLVAAPSCFKPNSLAVSGVTTTEATLTWVEAGLSTQWEVKLGAPGFDPNEEGSTIMVNTNPTLALDYLEANTNYEAYVRAICNPEGPTEWSNAVSFSTSRYPCVSYGTPGAEEEVTIGNGTTNLTYVPGYSLYDYSYSQQIYTADEIGGAGIINSIAFDISGVKSRQVDIYLVETDKSSFASGTDWVAVTDADKVFTGTIGNATGWETYNLTTPFNYTGTGNLVVVVDNNNGSWSSGLSAKGGAGYTNMAMYKYQDGTNIDPSNPPSGTRYSSRNNLRLGIQYATCITGRCNPPQVAIALSETEYAATLTFTNANEDVTSPSYGIIYGPQGFNPASAGTTVSPIANGTYTISGLAAQTTYDVYVYAICGSGDPDTVRYIFTTPFIPNCKTPIIDGTYGASNITYNTANLTWRQPGDVPQTWTVRYADADFNPATAAATDYTELIVPGSTTPAAQLTGLVAGTTYYVYIKATCATSPVLDESPWLSMSNANPAYTFTTPECVTPTAVAASNVTNSTAVIAWTGNAAAYTLKYGLAGFDLATEGTEVACTANSIELTGLDAYANYEVYVKSNCTATDESAWSTVCAFRTVCPDGGSTTIGDGTGTTTGVPVANYGSTYCQQIFTAEELREAGVANNIAGLAFNWQAIDASYDKYFTIWLANTDKSSFASTSDFVPYSELTKVYGPVFIEHGTGAGEQEYVFNNAFQWDGNSNIVVVTLMNAGAGDGNASRRAYTHNTGVSNITMYQRKDGSQYTEEQLATITGSSRTTYRANITFIAPCNTDVTCFAPATVTTAITPANVVTVNWAARTDLRPVVNNFELKYGLEGFNPETQGVLVPALNNVNTYIINADLAANTNYDVYVRTVCGENDHSKWTKASFTTYPTCWAPVSLTVTGTTSNSATLTWANNTEAPTAATRWEVSYGPEGFDPERGTKLETTNNTNCVVPDLNHSSKYEFYVRAICSSDDKSDWSSVATGTTQCGVWQYADMPLVENFDGVTGTTSSTINNHVLPNCWDYINTSTTTSGTSTTGYPGYPIAYNSASYSHSGNNQMRFYTYTTAAYGDQYAILPQFGFDLDTVVVGFYARESSTTATYVGKVVVGVMTDPEDASTFVAVDTILPTTTSYEYFEADMSTYEGNGRYIALKAPKPTTGYNIVYLDDLTVKLREKVNNLPNNGGTIVACNEFIMPDTTGGTYAGGLNATYVVRPGQAGHVARIQGDYDLENGYDYLNVYRGAANANNLVGRYTGSGSIDYMTQSELWQDSGYVTLVFTSDADNAFANIGFKFLVTCEQPYANMTPIEDVVEVNGTYTWTAGNGQTYTQHSTMDAAPDRNEDITFWLTNVAGYDSVARHLTLTVHPTYELNYSHVMCERDTFEFYGQTYTTTGNYRVTLQSVYGADSVGVLALQVNAAPTAAISYSGRVVTEVADFCDNADMALLARSNTTGATFEWEDASTDANRVVNPHESNTYTVVATNPTTGCTSLPATLTVTTTPIPALTISGENAICFGQSTTLTVADANALDASYVWKRGTTNVGTGTTLTVSPTETTTYTVTATTNNTSACAVTAEYTVTVNPLPVIATPTTSVSELCLNDEVTLTAQAVDGYTYEWSTGATTAVTTTVPTTTGTYTVTVTDLNGCVNEFTTAAVTVHPSYELAEERSACIGMLPYTWGAMSLTEAGNFDQHFTIAHGCDSLVHLTFVVEDTAVNNATRELCEGASFTFGEGIYEQAYTATESTVITYIDTTSGECPARYNLNLTVNTHNPASVENTVCDTYTWPLNNETYTVSGAYQTTLQTTKGCDSVVTLNLTVNYQNTGVQTETACDNYTWSLNGESYTASTNEPTFTLQNQWGCDSVVTLDLTVNYKSYHEDFHCVRDAESYTWIDGLTYNFNADIDDGIEFVTGTNADGCNEIAQLHLVLNPVTDILNWVAVEACDEYEVANAVIFDDENDCTGHIEPVYLRESGDYEIRTRATDGHDQLTRLHLTVTPSTYHTTIATECLPYTWTITDVNNQPFEIATITADMVNGAAIYNMSVDLAEAGYVASSCSSIEVLRLTPKYPTEVVDTVVTICKNGSWIAENNTVFYGADYDAGTYTLTWDESGLNEAGCKLTKQVELTVNPTVEETVDMIYCESQFTEADTINGTLIYNYIDGNDTLPLTIAAAGLNEAVYNNSLVANWETEAGCARTVTVNYTVNPVTREADTVEACYEYTWDLTGTHYTEPGTYTEEYETVNDYGCRHIVTLNLTISDTARSYDTIDVCTSYEYRGETYRKTMTFLEEAGAAANGCDSVHYVTYRVNQNTLNEQYVYSNDPYTWANGTEYSADVEGVYYEVPVAQGCDSVLMLHFTMGEPVVICENQLPYTIEVGNTRVVLDTDAVSGVWKNNDVKGNDTIIAYTINRNVLETIPMTACDSYTWTDNQNVTATYTESGQYTRTYTAANGCDSVATLNLTINASSNSTMADTACDTYTWNGTTYTTSGEYTFDTINAAGCDSTATLNLTINTNAGVEETVAACVTYTWMGTDYTASGDYNVSFTDVNGCVGDSVLHLTINQPITVIDTIVVNADTASYRFNGVLYVAPYNFETDGDIVDSSTSVVTGCDSTYILRLVIPALSTIDTLHVTACGTYTWDRTGHTYGWIPVSERQSHGMALFKDLTDNRYVYTYPVDTVFGTSGEMLQVKMLVLNLMQAEYTTDTLNLPLSLGTWTIEGIDVDHNKTYNFSGETVVGTMFYKRDTVMEASTAYCANYVDYTINLVNNYTVTRDTVCDNEATYTWHGEQILGTPGHTFAFEYVENAGTLDETVDSIYIYQLPVNNLAVDTKVACDSIEWNGTWYFASNNTATFQTTTARGCDSTVTLNLTINASTHDAFTAESCDTYTWSNNGSELTYTESGDYMNSYTNAAGCASTDTLHLTIKKNTNQGYTDTACVSYFWDRSGETYTVSCDTTYSYTATSGCPSVDTLHLTINMPTHTAYTETACDSMTWHGTTYYVSGDYNYDYNTEAGCASTDTLHLTINAATHNSETLTQCDSYEWHGTTYTASGDYTYEYTNVAGCASVDTLHLPINVNTTGVEVTETACDEYTWSINNRLYTTSGDYTARTTDTNGCGTTNTLHLTINSTSSYDSVLYVSDGSYQYTAQNNNVTFYEPGVYNITETYTNAANCDSLLNIELHVGTALLEVEVASNCSEYTWRNGKTYTWLSSEERAAHQNADNQNAIYYNSTDQEYVYYMPTYVVPQQNGYDSIYMLNLTLTQSITTTDVVNFPISLGVLNYGDSTFDFSAQANKDFVNATEYREVHFSSNYYCDSIVDVTINLVNNYTEAETADICVTENSYTWRGQTISTATSDFDHAHTYYIYDTIENADSLLTTIEYLTLTQHPVVYATERRTACDSYEWNGNTYTESTSNATFATVNQYGCDSTVTLMLTINHNTNTVYDVPACETYTWTAANGGNGETYTESGTYTYDYNTAQGCPSTNTLNLTINHNTSTEYTVDACDSYIWTVEEGGNGLTYTTAGTYTYDYNTVEGCPSTNTLTLTLRENSNQTVTKTVCDTYTWTAAEGGNGETYTVSGTYYFDYEAENGCPSTNTLNLTVNQNSGHTDVMMVCDSTLWHGTKYMVSGTYTYDYADANNCPSIDTLTLTVNQSTNNVATVVECNSYTWTEGDGNDYTVSGTYTYDYVNAAGCASTDTLHLTIGTGHAFGIERVTVCGPYTWVVNGEEIAVIDESVETSTVVTNPATGCDSTIFLYLTVNPQTVTEVAICDNQTYTWAVNDTKYSTSGTYTESVNDGDGNCVSEEVLVLTVNETKETSLTDQVCLGNGYTGNNFNIAAADLPTAGEYTFIDSLNTVNGCDSIVTLTLTVGDVINNPVEAVACDSYAWNAGDGETYNFTASGTYTSEAYANAEGCTTMDVLTLTINQNAGTEYNEIVCDGYMWNGTQYTESGDYTYDYTDGNGCASTDVLHLTVNASTINTVEMAVCDEYKWEEGDGETYTASGVYTYNYTTSDGCNGTTYLVLTVNNSTNSNETVNACDSYTWNGTTYVESGDYTFNGTNAAGCDSISVLHLTVNASTSSEAYATSCNFYNWHGETYTESGDYTFTSTNDEGCTHTEKLYLTVNQPVASAISETVCGNYTWNGITYAATGVYTQTFTAENGCDSVVTLTLTVNQPVSTAISETACGSYTWNGETYTTSGIYTDTTTATNGCDSVVTLSLTILQPVNTTENAVACDSYTWNGTTYTTSGTYTSNFTDANGCAAVATLNLTVNNSSTATVNATACGSYNWNGQTYTTSGTYTYQTVNVNGCDSVVTLTLTVNTPMNTTESQVACDSYTWNGQTYTTSGTYTRDFTDVNGCAATGTLYLTILQPANTTESAVACNSYNWNGQTYTTSGTYTSNFTDANGCAAVATLNLTINNAVTNTVTVSECGSYTWNGITYVNSGSYTYTATAANGCDSTVTLNLTINQPTSSTVLYESCSDYTWNGQTYTTSGLYTYTTTNAAGCDSVVTLAFTRLQPVYSTENATACGSYNWNGQTYTTSGTYTYTTTSASGCDSVVTLNLTINSTVSTNLTETACGSYSWNGQTYTTSGNYTQVFTAASGCDSTVTLALTVNQPVEVTLVEDACSSYEWNGQTYTTSGTYTYTSTAANGCDSTVTLILTINMPVYTNLVATADGSYLWNGETYTESGVYTYTTNAANGCDSIVTLTLTVNPIYTVTLVSANSEWGTVSESGSIVENGYFTAIATANEGYEFVGWVNGTETVSTNSTYIFQVTEDITLTAVFAEKQGINDVDMANVTIYSTDTRIIVRGAEGHDVYVYDVNGRMMDRQFNAPETLEFRMTATGVYLVKVGNAPAKRVVVVR